MSQESVQRKSQGVKQRPDASPDYSRDKGQRLAALHGSLCHSKLIYCTGSTISLEEEPNEPLDPESRAEPQRETDLICQNVLLLALEVQDLSRDDQYRRINRVIADWETALEHCATHQGETIDRIEVLSQVAEVIVKIILRPKQMPQRLAKKYKRFINAFKTKRQDCSTFSRLTQRCDRRTCLLSLLHP